MKSNELDHLWLDYLQSRQRVGEAPADLRDALQAEPEARKAFVEERAVDSMLRLMAQTDSQHDAFVANCIHQYQKTNPPSSHELPPGESAHDIQMATFQVPGIPQTRAASAPRAAGRRMNPLQKILAMAVGLSFPLAVIFWLVNAIPETDRHATGPESNTTGNLDDAAAEFRNKFSNFSKSDVPQANLNNIQPNENGLPQSPEVDDPMVALETSDQRSGAKQPLRSAGPPIAVARVISSPGATWRIGPPGDALSAGEYWLTDGQARIVLDGGSAIDVMGPTKFSIPSPREFVVQQGNILATMAAPRPIVVSSPAAEFDQLDASRFQIRVDASGQSEVFVNRGRIVLRPLRQEMDRPWTLDAKHFNQALVSVPREPQSLGICMARGPDGFRGLIDVDGKSVELQSHDAFASVVDQMANIRSRAPQDFARHWQEFVNRWNQGAFAGSMGTGDERQAFGSFDELFEIFRQQQQKIRDSTENGATHFPGVIDFNGQQRNFNSMQQLERLKSQMLGPLFDNSDFTHNSAFQGVINVNGREMRFTSPQAFQQAKDQLNR